MSRRLIRALSTRACVFISRAFADGDSYKHTKSGNENRRKGQAGVFVHVSKEFSKGGESFSETFAATKITVILKLLES